MIYRFLVRRSSPFEDLVVIFLIFVAGGMLFVFQPVFLAPPFSQITDLLYAILAMVWFPLLLRYVLFRPGLSQLVSTVIGCAALLMFGCCGFFAAFSALTAFSVNTCQSLESGHPDKVRYVCDIAPLSDASQFYVFEGDKGSPFMFRVSAAR